MEHMQPKFRIYRRGEGVFYWQEIGTTKRGSLRTKDRHAAEELVRAMNETHRQPTLNLALGRAYLSAHDPKMIERTWQQVMDEMASHGTDSTRVRCHRAMRCRAFEPLRSKVLVQTTSEDLLAILRGANNSTAFYLRRIHNLAFDFGWLPWPVLPNSAWPKIHSKTRRAITEAEHLAIIAQEQNTERRAYYELLWLTGASQTDAAELTAEHINWRENVLSYRRKKLGPHSEPARMTIGPKLRTLLLSLPQTGDLFPRIKKEQPKHRSTEFARRCRVANIKGVSLHCYRHAWAQRAKACGYPQRFAQEALGHASKAVHEAYARGGIVVCPALDDYEQIAAEKIAPIPGTHFMTPIQQARAS
jgi:integrase